MVTRKVRRTDAEDGNWHTFVYQIIFLNRTNTYPNLNVREKGHSRMGGLSYCMF
jgi:hypothetical protein